MPSAASPRTVGSRISLRIRGRERVASIHAGDTVPMPPVFGPVVAVEDRLVVLDRRQHLEPLAVGEREHRRPRARRSAARSTSVAPASPNRRASSISRAAARASSASRGDDHALARREPVRLDDHAARRRSRSIAASASATVAATSNGAVGMPWRAKNCLLNTLLPSSRAPAAPGPNVASPAARSRSASPATSGASGPTTTRSTPSSSASRDQPLVDPPTATSGTHRATSSIPGLPGAATTS